MDCIFAEVWPYIQCWWQIKDVCFYHSHMSIIVISLLSLGGLFGNIIFGFITNRFGRRIPLFFVASLLIVSNVLILFAHHVYYLYVARILAGVFGGAAYVIYIDHSQSLHTCTSLSQHSFFYSRWWYHCIYRKYHMTGTERHFLYQFTLLNWMRISFSFAFPFAVFVAF